MFVWTTRWCEQNLKPPILGLYKVPSEAVYYRELCLSSSVSSGNRRHMASLWYKTNSNVMLERETLFIVFLQSWSWLLVIFRINRRTQNTEGVRGFHLFQLHEEQQLGSVHRRRSDTISLHKLYRLIGKYLNAAWFSAEHQQSAMTRCSFLVLQILIKRPHII